MNDEVPGRFGPCFLVFEAYGARDSRWNAQEEGVQNNARTDRKKSMASKGVNGFTSWPWDGRRLSPRIIKEAALLPENQLDTRPII